MTPANDNSYDYETLIRRLNTLPEIQISAYVFYIQFQLPPIIGGKPKWRVPGLLYVRIGKNRKNDREVSLTWYPGADIGPSRAARWPDVLNFPTFPEVQERLGVPDRFYREAWAKVYRTVTEAPPEPEEMHTLTGYDEAKALRRKKKSSLEEEIELATYFLKSAPRPYPAPVIRLPLLAEIERMHEMTEYDK